ncbi:class I SAM-dependent methyltransferase [Clostridium sp. D2Q-11]|uniref:Class I SAM-dependent methyltransferase n=1 Tax=Anaeromonas frigoriresistens TaxID=2683708 RepID=A0A942UWU5_9FIRM|nr:class I SAM-dependent methyltransferase [Anaeromonas frigoriresistens]MBS4539550.1 class I SAM-dependent methyltransferase [Anaeromonas frigoriresistens]
MPHKFDPKHKEKLDSEKRREIFKPNEILNKLLLQKGYDVADIGCGTGFFSIPAAKIIGENNKVYASDISEEMLDVVKEKIEKENINNIELIKGTEYDSPVGEVDYIILSNIFHEVADKDKFLKNYLAYLRNNGLISFIEWKKKDTEEGPPYKDRLDSEELISIVEEKGLVVVDKIDINETHYGLVVRKI